MKLINFCEIDKFASKSYSNIHEVSEELNLGDISVVETKNVKDFDLLVGGSPCFVSGTPVFTNKGNKHIEDIKVGDMVLTHKNRFMPVVRIGHDYNKEIYELKAMGSLPILGTPNHPFFVVTRRKKYKTENGKRKVYYEFSEPYKKSMDKLEVGKDFLCSSILSTSENPLGLDKKTCWLLGRYVAAGCISNNSVIITIGKDKVSDFEKILGNIDVNISETKTNTKNYTIKDENLKNLIKNLSFGRNSLTKNIPNEILNLPSNLLESFLDGYFAGDGCYIEIKKIFQATTVSYNLALTLKIAIQKVYKTACRFYFDKRPETHIIEGRIVNQHDTYMIRFQKIFPKAKTYYIINDMILYPIKSVINKNYKDTVYNLEVKEDHSYNIQLNYCSNCQDYSSAGKKAGATYTCLDCEHKYNPLEQHYSKRDKCPKCNSTNIEVTRSSLIVHYLRFLHDKKPKFAIYENVKNLQNKEFRPTFNLFLKEVEEYGYHVFWKVLNAKDYGIPQNRERIIVVCIRNDVYKKDFIFPDKIPLKLSVRSILEENVDEMYYIKKETSDKLIQKLILEDKLIENYKINEIQMLGLLDILGFEQMKRVYGSDGISPTLTTMQGGNTEPKFLEENFTLPICAASRGRNTDNPTSRVSGLPTEQRLEINTKGVSNTLTSVQKDNYILEENLPAIMKQERNEYGKKVRKEYESGKLEEQLKNMRDYVPRNDGLANTLTTVQKDNYVLESLIFENNYWLLKKYKKFYDKYHYIPEKFNPNDFSDHTSKFTFVLNEEGQECLSSICNEIEIAYRVRKLTPRECYRLMGFNDEEYDKARYFTEEEQKELDESHRKYKKEPDLKGVIRGIKTSNAQMYKQAGNSIVVEVLYYVFKQLKEDYPKDFKDISVCSLFSGIGAFESALKRLEDEDSLVSNIFSENFQKPPMS